MATTIISNIGDANWQQQRLYRNLIKNNRGLKSLFGFGVRYSGGLCDTIYRYSTNRGATWSSETIFAEYPDYVDIQNLSAYSIWGQDTGTSFKIVEIASRQGFDNSRAHTGMFAADVNDNNETIGTPSSTNYFFASAGRTNARNGFAICCNDNYWVFAYKYTTTSQHSLYIRACTIQNPTNSQIIDSNNWTSQENSNHLIESGISATITDQGLSSVILLPYLISGNERKFVLVWASNQTANIKATVVTYNPTLSGDARLSFGTVRNINHNGTITRSLYAVLDPTDTNKVFISFFMEGTSYSSKIARLDLSNGDYTIYTLNSGTNATSLSTAQPIMAIDEGLKTVLVLAHKRNEANNGWEKWFYIWDGNGFGNGNFVASSSATMLGTVQNNHRIDSYFPYVETVGSSILYDEIKLGTLMQVSYGTEEGKVINGEQNLLFKSY